MHLGASNRRSSPKLETLCLETAKEEKYWGVKAPSKMTRSF